jgi:hypothetical protein
MRSIPGTITQYTKDEDQVELLDLTPAERADKILASRIAKAKAIEDEAKAARLAIEEGRA